MVGSVDRIGTVAIAKIKYDDGEEKAHHMGVWRHKFLKGPPGNEEEEEEPEEEEQAAPPGAEDDDEEEGATANKRAASFETDADLVDMKLWQGAAEAGWSLKANAGNHYVYLSPCGRKFTSKRAAEEAREDN